MIRMKRAFVITTDCSSARMLQADATCVITPITATRKRQGSNLLKQVLTYFLRVHISTWARVCNRFAWAWACGCGKALIFDQLTIIAIARAMATATVILKSSVHVDSVNHVGLPYLVKARIMPSISSGPSLLRISLDSETTSLTSLLVFQTSSPIIRDISSFNLGHTLTAIFRNCSFV